MSPKHATKILIVDDKPENLFTLEKALKSVDAVTHKARSGEEALSLSLRYAFALILLDVQMPGMDGFETALLMRENESTRNIPIIFVTAISKERNNIFRGYDSGAVDYLFKPIDPDILNSKVRVFLRLYEQNRLLEEKNRELEREISERKRMEAALLGAYKETDDIMRTVDEGLFLVYKEGKQYVLGNEHSRVLIDILSNPNPANQELIALLENKMTPRLKNCVEIFMELMFRGDVHEDVLNFLNPLRKLEFSLSGSSETEQKHLVFSFLRNSDRGRVQRLLGRVKDVTQEVLLARRLAETEARKQNEQEIIFSILQYPALIVEFLEDSRLVLEELHVFLDGPVVPGKWERILVSTFRYVHNLKGNAELLELRLIVERIHLFEDKIIKLQDGPENYANLSLLYDGITEMLNEIKNYIERIDILKHAANSRRYIAGDLLLEIVNRAVERIGLELGKQVAFLHTGFNELQIPTDYRKLVRDILVQLVRNSISHGLETPERRERLGKDPMGKILLSAVENESGMEFVLHDDGQGLDSDELQRRARYVGLQKGNEIVSKEQLVELVFVRGISTAAFNSQISGRGMGLDLIREKIRKQNGSINVNFETGRFCEFRIILPMPSF